MEYTLHPPQLQAFNQKRADLPEDANRAIDNLLGLLTVAPWSSQPLVEQTPQMAYRFITFSVPRGYGAVTFVIQDDQRSVSPINLMWYPYET